MFGGWTAAALLNAVVGNPQAGGTPAAITVSFIEGIVPGTDVTVRVRCRRSGRSVEHWHAELLADDDQRPMAHASVVTGHRRVTKGHLEPVMPRVPGPDDGLEPFPPPGAVGEQVTSLAISGSSFLGQSSTASLGWIRERSGRAVDHVQLALLADLKPPRSFYWHDALHPSSTVMLSVYFLATPEEVSTVGDDYVLCEAVGTRGADSLSGEQVRLWSRDGILLATSEQLCWYR